MRGGVGLFRRESNHQRGFLAAGTSIVRGAKGLLGQNKGGKTSTLRTDYSKSGIPGEKLAEYCPV